MQNKLKHECRICKASNFKTVIDFGKTPLVNSLIEKEDLDKKKPVYPLVVEQCQNCFLVQIVNPIDAHKIYREQDYLYFSGDMPNLSDYFKEYADDIKTRFLKKGDFVIEIGSNDGTMLQHFGTDYPLLGVDPSTNVVVKALAKGIPTISDFFTERLAKSISRFFGKAKVVYGNNCIAHLKDIHDLMKGVKEVLTDDGVFIVECNYWGGMVKNKNYSLIYHDHFSYFTAKNWQDVGLKYGLWLNDAVVTPAQGGSLRVFLSNTPTMTARCKQLLKEEIDTNLPSYETAKKYNKECTEEAEKLGKLIKELKAEGKTIAGYGAAAKGFSILHLAGITENEIRYFVDDSPAKQGKYTPVTHIPVIKRAIKDPDYFFITAPNYAKEIIAKEQKFLENGGKCILSDSTIVG